MSNSHFVPFRVGDRLLVLVVAMLLLIAGVAWNTIAIGVRPSDDMVRTLLTLGSFMFAAIGVTSPFARRFDIRHKARLDRVHHVAAALSSSVAAKVRSIRLPFGR